MLHRGQSREIDVTEASENPSQTLEKLSYEDGPQHGSTESNRDSVGEARLLSEDPHEQSSEKRAAAEYSVPTQRKFIYLGGYFTLNLALTLLNKLLLNQFPYPWLLTTIHSTCTALGCSVLLYRGSFKLTPLGYRENIILLLYSTLFTANIAMSNVSLAQVSVAFHQLARSTCPAFTVLFYRVIFDRKYSYATYFSLMPIIIGVSIATYGEQYFNLAGFILTFSGVILAVAKTMITNRLLTGSLKLPTLELLFRMAPLAAVQTVSCSAVSGEITNLGSSIPIIPGLLLLMLFFNGALAFVLNVSSFQTNKVAGALTLTIAANMKQCLTIVLGIIVSGNKVSILNVLGISLALSGAAWYSYAEIRQR